TAQQAAPPAEAVAEAAPVEQSAESTPLATHAEAHDHEHDAAADHGEHADDGHDDAGHEEPEPPPPEPPALGEIFRGRIGSVAESGHIAIVNRIIDVPAAKQKLLAAREKRRRVRGVVFGFNRGGFDV